MTAVRITGGCQCGAVRHALHSAPVDPSICHCRMCQKQFGNFFGTFAGVDMKDFEMTRGELAAFRSSEAAERVFCAQCGTPLGFRYRDRPRISVSIGLLDEPVLMKPTVQYGLEGRLPWLPEILANPGTTTGTGDPKQERYEEVRTHPRQHPDHDTAAWPPENT